MLVQKNNEIVLKAIAITTNFLSIPIPTCKSYTCVAIQ